MPDLAAYNADPALRDTPLGDLVVVMLGRDPAVGIVDRIDPSRSPRVIHMLSEGGVFASCYGKRWWEQAAVKALYDGKHEAHLASYEREEAARSVDLEHDVTRWLGKEGARDTLLENL